VHKYKKWYSLVMEDSPFGNLQEELLKAGLTRESVERVRREALKGYIYVIKCNEYYKIGSSRDGVEKRLNGMQTGNPYELLIVAKYCVTDYLQAEALLHKYFKDKRVRGEWFKLDKEDLILLDKIDE
jgi:hypothetical protein